MIECGLAGKLDDGRAHAEALLPVVQSLFVEPNPAVFKGVLHAQGRIPTPDVRLPLVNASDGRGRASRSPRSTPRPTYRRDIAHGATGDIRHILKRNGCVSELAGCRTGPPHGACGKGPAE